MFFNCLSLISLPDISNWNTNSVKNIMLMFFNCSSLSSLPDISKWNTNNLNKMMPILFGCNNLIISEKTKRKFQPHKKIKK